MVGKDPVALREALYDFHDLTLGDVARLEALIAKAGWPTECPVCGVETVLAGWDVDTSQCRECWKGGRPAAELRAHETGDHLINAMIAGGG